MVAHLQMPLRGSERVVNGRVGKVQEVRFRRLLDQVITKVDMCVVDNLTVFDPPSPSSKLFDLNFFAPKNCLTHLDHPQSFSVEQIS